MGDLIGYARVSTADQDPALQLGHTDGGRLIRELYGHPDAALARDRVREAFRSVAQVTSLTAAA